MAACGSLQHIFENPLPENATLFQTLSPWQHLQSIKSIEEDSSFTEIFGELHFKESPVVASASPLALSSSLSSSSSSIDFNPQVEIEKLNKDNNERNNKSPTENYFPSTQRKYRHSDSFSSMNSESLSLCTEGLGFESSDDVEDYINNDWQCQEERIGITKHTSSSGYLYGEPKRSSISGRQFPPPISCIGRSGKPWVCFKSYRYNGRFILKEVRIRTQEFLHACREDGRLKLQFIQSDDEIIEGGEEEDDTEEEEEEEEERKENEEEKYDDNHEHTHDHD